jgi:hypothetical protein
MHRGFVLISRYDSVTKKNIAVTSGVATSVEIKLEKKK